MTVLTRDLISAGVLLTFLTSLLGFLQMFRKVKEVRVRVDGRLDELLGRVAVLTDALHAADVEVPPTNTPP